MRSSFEEVGYLISYMVVSSMLESLTALCNRGRLCKPRAEQIYTYIIYAMPRRSQPKPRNRLPQGNPRQVKLILAAADYYVTHPPKSSLL